MPGRPCIAASGINHCHPISTSLTLMTGSQQADIPADPGFGCQDLNTLQPRHDAQGRSIFEHQPFEAQHGLPDYVLLASSHGQFLCIDTSRAQAGQAEQSNAHIHHSPCKR